MSRNRNISRLLIALLVGSAGVVAAPVFHSSSSVVLAADSDAQITADVQKRLSNKNYKGVTVMVNSGTVTLSGQVDLFAYKADAVKKAKKAKGVKDVRDNIAVGGPTIPDDVLQHKLLSRIEVDRVGFGQVFDAISVHVQNGVVTLGGHAVGPVAQSSAVSLTSYMPGVKQVINQISVDPVSPMDNGIRVRVYRAIYGYPALRQYAIVPSKPIRISVQNGHVTLYGIVNNQMDKQLAYTRAMQVPNVFSVTNDLVVENQGAKK
jgi:hyperosmotically inducible periplasmic protein